ncbi:MAG: hypothetical protein DMF98_28055, partial [Acidobacteria bacterium]
MKVGERLDDFRLGLQFFLEVFPLHRVRDAVHARTLPELGFRHVRDHASERADLSRRSRLEAVFGLRHLLGFLGEI